MFQTFAAKKVSFVLSPKGIGRILITRSFLSGVKKGLKMNTRKQRAQAIEQQIQEFKGKISLKRRDNESIFAHGEATVNKNAGLFFRKILKKFTAHLF